MNSLGFAGFPIVLGGPARYVRFLRPVIATRGVKIRPPAYGPDFVKATHLGRRPLSAIPATPHSTYIFQSRPSLMVNYLGAANAVYTKYSGV